MELPANIISEYGYRIIFIVTHDLEIRNLCNKFISIKNKTLTSEVEQTQEKVNVENDRKHEAVF